MTGQRGNPIWWENKRLRVEKGKLLLDGKDLEMLGREFGTPIYVYSTGQIRDNYQTVVDTLKAYAPSGLETRVYYAMKANGALEVLQTLKSERAFIDTSSVGEVKRCLQLGFSPSSLIFTGTNFGLDEFEFLATSGVLFNVDSFSQLKRLREFAPMRVSIRLNPSVGGVGFNEKFDMSGKTGKASRLGIYIDRIIEAFHTARSYGLEPVCLHQHVGSNWLRNSSFEAYMQSVKTAISVVKELEAVGFSIEVLNLGGGLGVRSNEQYEEFPLQRFCQEINKAVAESNLKVRCLAIEPGRYVAGNTGVLLATANMVEQKNGTNFVGLDVGFNAFHHKFLYGIENTVVNISKIEDEKTVPSSVVGYLGEQGDVFAENEALPDTKEGDIFMLYPAGAYCASELAEHHLLPVPKELYLEDQKTKTSLSLKNYCKACRKSCCFIGPISITETERSSISRRTGRDDFFFIAKSGVIQIANSVGQPCQFLDKDGLTCTIQEIKPIECKAYPVLINKKSERQNVLLAGHCPAKHLIDESYKDNALKELSKIPAEEAEHFYQINKDLGHC